MRANAAGSYSPLDWVRDHHMLTFLAAAALFAIFYGLYVYLQISNPGLFRSAPPPIAAPVQVTQAPPATMQTTPAQSAPAPAATGNETPSVTGMPEGQAQTASAPQGAGSAASETRDEPVAAADEPAPASDTKIRFVPVSQSQTPARAETQASTARPRSRPAQAVTPIETRTDSDGVEVVEIPAPPSVAALPPGEEVPATSGIAVERQSTNRSPIDPELMAAYEALVQGDYQKASTLYGKVLVRSPDNADAMLGLAAIAWKQGRPSVASGYYARVLERDPRNSHAQAGLIALLGSADPVAAETKLKQLISREPSGFLYFTLGNLYAEQGLWSQAQYAYFQAYQLDPDNPDYAYNLAVGLEHLGQSRPALDHYRKALDLSFKKGRANFDQELAIERVGQLSARIR